MEFKQIHFEKVPSSQNTRADILSKLSAGEPMEGTWIEILERKSIANHVCTIIEIEDWRTTIRNFILQEQLPDDPQEARIVRTTTPRFVLIEDQLYIEQWVTGLYSNL